MLYILDGQGNFDHRTIQWHTGEPVPKLSGRVMTFQADGDELELFLAAMAGKAFVREVMPDAQPMDSLDIVVDKDITP